MRTIHPDPRRALPRLAVVLVVSGLLALALADPSSAADRRPGAAGSTMRIEPPTAKLNSVGSRYVGARIPIKGYTWGVSRGKHRVVLQRWSATRQRWVWRDSTYARSGVYRLRAQRVWTVGTVRFRTVLHDNGRRVAVSKPITVQVLAPPTPEPPTQPAT